MSIESEMTRIEEGVSDAMSAIEERGVNVSETDNVSTLGALIRSIPSGSYIPTLSESQRQDLVNLANSYYNNRINPKSNEPAFVYVGGVNRNYYANKDCYNDSGKIKLNCSTFVQLLWAGISPDSFLYHSDDFAGVLNHNFDWGYWFKFPFRKCYNLTAPNGPTNALTMFGFIQPDPDTYEGAYSITTYYSPNGTNANKGQYPKTFMTAADMARELKFLGCEIPLSEAMTGDIVFLKAPRLDDNQADDTDNASYMNINHVAMITSSVNIAECDLSFVECSTYYTTAIGAVKVSHTSTSSIFRAVEVIDRIVMVARHPAAFGIVSAVPDFVTPI